MRRVVIAGGTGFLGSRLRARLRRDGWSIDLLSRRGAAGPGDRVVQWHPDGKTGPWAATLDGAAAVINLAGESIDGQRWSAARKRAILESRIDATRSLAAAVAASTAPPPVFVSASGIGYYGARGSEVVTEADAAGNDFLARVCVEWEREAEAARSPQTRVVELRTGHVLERKQGALPRLLPPFRFGVGGPLGSGDQYWPWIHIDDWTELVVFALTRTEVTGPLNLSAPAPVSNRVFSTALGRALHRPAIVPAPAFALRLILGEMAHAVLTGQRAVPRKALQHGYVFRYEEIGAALRALVGHPAERV
jgi:uncharacterized protein (TIGR01777 family)